MFKVIENNQIIDVMETLTFVKCLPKSKRIIHVDERQANGIVASNGDEVYHLYGTKNTFADFKRTVRFEKIDEEEYNRLVNNLKDNEKLERRISELEKIIKEIYQKVQ